MKTCPFCAEEIQDAAIVCKHCGRDLPKANGPETGVAPASATPSSAPPKSAAAPRTKKSTFAIVALVIGFLVAIAGGAAGGLGILMMWIGMALLLPGNLIIRWGGGFVGAVLLGAMAISAGRGGTPPNRTTSAPPTASTASAPASQPAAAPEPSYQLALLSSRGYESEHGGYHYVEGEVKNISSEPLQNVMVVATWLDKDGHFIKSDDALIDYNPILPGQTSPYKTISTGNPAMARFRVGFKTLMGGTLNVDDQRKK